MAFSKTSKDISLDGTLLHAQCIDAHGEYQDSEIDLNQYIANVNGTLKWKSNGNFVKSSKKITVEGSVLKCKTRNKFHQWHQTELDLDEKIANCNGRLVYGFQRAIIAVNEHNVEEVTQYIKGVYEANKDEVFTQVAEGTDHKVIYINTNAGRDEGVVMQVSAGAEASVLHLANENGGTETVNVDVLQTKIGTWASCAGAGVALSTNIIDAKVSIFDLTLGCGLDTGAGIHNDSLTFNVLGSGFSFGRQMKFNIFGNSIGVDFKRCAPKKVQKWERKCKDVVNIDTLDGIQPKLDGIQPKLDGIQPKIDGIQSKIDESQQNLDGMRLKIDGIEPMLDGIEPKMEGIQPKLDGIQPNLDGIQPKLDGIPKMEDRIQSKIDGFQQNLDGIQPKIDRIEPMLDRNEPKLEGIQPKPEGIQVKLDGTQPKLDGIQPQLDGIQSNLDGIQPKLDGIQPKLDGIQPKLDGTQPRRNSAEARRNSTEARRNSAEARRNSMEAKGNSTEARRNST